MKKGVTLVTLVVAIIIISVISTIAVISVNDIISTTNLKTFAMEMYNLQNLVDKYKAKNNGNLDFTTYIVNIADLTGELAAILSEDESPESDEIIFYLLDTDALSKLGVEKLNFGNGNDERDMYAVSASTGRVYYLYGFDSNRIRYYYLTSDLIDLIIPEIDTAAGSEILFIPSTYIKTREAVKVTVKIPKTINVSTVSITTLNNTNPTISTYVEEENYYIYTVNTNDWKGNYTVNVEYTEDAEEKVASYSVEEYLGVYGILYSDGELRINNTGKIDEAKVQAGNTIVLQSTDITDSTTIPWSSNAASITKVAFENEVIPTYVASWFNGCTNLTEVNNIEYLDTSKVTNMSAMFYNCRSLKKLDISTLNATNIDNMWGMFRNCANLEVLNMAGFRTDKNLILEETFWGCNKLKEVDLSGISKVRSMYSAFRDCVSLTELDLNHIKGVTYLGCAFMNCNSLTTLKVENMDVSNNKYLEYAFSGCRNLENLDLSKWDVGKVTTLEYTFLNCRKLKELDLNNWDTSQVTNMHQTFRACISLENIYVNNWDTTNVTTFNSMFDGCTALKEIDMTNWNVANVEKMARNVLWML